MCGTTHNTISAKNAEATVCNERAFELGSAREQTHVCATTVYYKREKETVERKKEKKKGQKQSCDMATTEEEGEIKRLAGQFERRLLDAPKSHKGK